MPKDGRYDDLAAFLRLRGDALMRTAVLLAPGREGGEDLLQEALERIMGKWYKIDGDPEGYLRRIMYSRAVDGWRSRSRHPAAAGHPAAVNPKPAIKVENAAYVLRRAAAAQVNSYQMISMSRDVSGIEYTDISTQQQRYIAATRASDGQPFFEWADIIKDGTWTDTTIVNQQRVWSVQSASTSDHSPFGAAGLTISSFLPMQTSPDPAAAFNAALKQGTIVVVGHRNLNGRDTILISVKPPVECGKGTPPLPGNPSLPAGVKPAKCINGYYPGDQAPADELWVDASTYLLVQTKTFEKSSNWNAPNPTWESFITQVAWLPPTPENLAKLTITPPSGYAKIPYTDLAKYLGPIS